jgi:hypothetical protein
MGALDELIDETELRYVILVRDLSAGVSVPDNIVCQRTIWAGRTLRDLRRDVTAMADKAEDDWGLPVIVASFGDATHIAPLSLL